MIARRLSSVPPALRFHRLAAAVAGLCLPVWLQPAVAASALPTGLQVVQGQASVVTQGAQMTVRNTPGAILNWQSFSIGAGNGVYFDQASAASKVLNRVTGNDPSLILGRLGSNGQVWLLNPNGVLFGQGARIDVAGLVASTLRLNDNDFLAGRYRFSAEGNGAAVVNQGSLKTSLGGQVVLLGERVENSGSIEAGQINLAAARSVTLVDTGAPNLAVRVDVPAGEVLNLGKLVANGGVVDVYGAIVNQQGLVQADTLGPDAQGRLVLRAADTLTLAEGSVTQSQGGQITLDAGNLTHVLGTLDASSAQAQGGGLKVQGTRILLGATALLDASGATGGGSIRIGGDFQGRGSEVRHADMLSVAAGARLRANATVQGDGGLVVLWADTATRFAGDADARGGALGGHGGLVEVSSKGYLDFRGRSDRSAPGGREGLLLLDPTNLTIQSSGADVNGDGSFGDDLSSPTLAFAAPGGNSFITSDAVVAQLASGNVVLQATNNISVNHDIVSGSSSSLTLQAGNDILVSSPITVGGALTLSANDAGGLPSGFGKVTLAAALTAGGSVFITNGGGTGVHAFGSDISAPTLDVNGSITLSANNAWTLSGGTSVIANNIGGTGGLTKSGSGTLQLTAPNTFSGGVQISGGTLDLQNSSAAGSGTLQLSSGTLNLGAGVFLANGLAVTGGTLGNDGGNSGISGNLGLAGDLGVNVAGPALTLSGTITGTAGLQIFNGNLVLTGSNTYSGDTQISGSGARLTLSGATAAAGTGQIGVFGGSLYVNDGAVVGNAVSVSNGTLANNSGSGTISGAVQAFSDITLQSFGGGLTLSGSIGGDGGLLVPGGSTGVITISGNNSFAGNVNLQGALTVAGGSAIPDQATVEMLASSGRLVLAGSETIGTLQSSQGDGAVDLGSHTLTVGIDSNSGFSGVISGTGSLVKVGAGSLTLSGANTYSGGTLLSDGTLAVTGTDNLGSGPVQLDPGTVLALGAGASLSNALTINSATITLDAGAAQLSGSLVLADDALFDVNGSGLTLSGALSGVGQWFKSGSGTLTLAGTNTGTGDATVQAGTLVASGGSALSPTALLTLDASTVLALASNESVGMLAGGGDVQLGSSTLTLLGTSSSTLSGNISGSGGLTLNGPGTLTLASFNAYTGATRVLAGTVVLSGSDRLPSTAPLEVANGATLVLGGGEFVSSLTLGGTLSGTGTLEAGSYTLTDGAAVGVSLGAGTLTSSGSAALAGSVAASDITVTNGALTIGAANLLNASASVTVNSGATLSLAANNSAGTFSLAGTVTGAGAFTVGNLNANGGTALIANNVVVGNAAVVQSGSLTVGNGGTTGSLSAGNIAISAGAVLAYDRSDPITLATPISGSGTLRQAGSGTLTLATAAPALAAVDVAAGVLVLANGNGDRIGDSTAVTVGSPATLVLGDTGETVGSLSIAGALSGSARLTAATYTLQPGSLVQAALGAGSLQAVGNGTATLNANSQAGTVDVASGATLSLGASASLAASAAVNVAGGGTLDLGVNTLAGSLVLAGNLSGVATLTAASYQLDSGAVVSANLGGGTLAVNGPVTLNGTAAADTVSVASGQLLLQGNGRLIAAPTTTVAAGATLSLNGSQTLGTLAGAGNVDLQGGSVLSTGLSGSSSFSGVISGTGALEKVGTGTFTLSGSHAYTGSTVVTAGTLATGGNDVLPDGSLVIVQSGATLNLGGNDTVGTLTLSGTLGGSGQTLTAASYVLNGGTANANLGAGTLTSNGSSTLVGSSAATSVTVAGGTLTLAAAERLADSADLTVAANATLALNGDETVGTLSLQGNITGTGTLITSIAQLTGGTYNFDITAATLISSGNSVLNGTASAGTVTVNSGTLTLGAANRFTGAPDVTILNGASLVLGGAETFGSLAGAGALTLGGAPLTVGSSGASTTFSGAINGNGGLTKVGSGTLTLSGPNSYTGPTTLNAGGLNFDSATTLDSLLLGGGTLGGSGALVVSGNFDVPAAAALAGSGSFTTQGSSHVNPGSGALTLDRAWTNNGTLLIDGNGAITFGAAAKLLNGATATLVLDSSNALVMGGGQGTFDNVGALQQNAAGTHTLNIGRLDNSGSVVVNAGTLVVAADGSDSGSWATASGSTLQFGGGTRDLGTASNPTGSGSLAVSAGIVNLNGTALTLLPLLQSGGSFNVNGSTSVTVPGLTLTGGVLALNGGSINLPANTSLGAGTLSLASASPVSVTSLSLDGSTLTGAHDLVVSGSFVVGGSADSTFSGSGTLRTDGSSSLAMSTAGGALHLAGTRNWLNNGTVSFTGSTGLVLGQGSNDNNSFTNAAGATINLDAPATFAINGSGAGSSSLLNAGTLNQNSAGSHSIVVGSFSNTGTLHIAAGLLQLNAAFTQAGTLDTASGSTFLAANDFTNTGTLSGSGTLRLGSAGTGTLTNQGGIAPGNSPGTLSIEGNLTLGSNSVLTMEVGGATAGQFDRVAVSGNLQMGGSLNATLINGYQPANGDFLPLLASGGTASGSIALPTLPSGFTLGYNLAAGEAARMIFSNLAGSRIFTNAAGDLDWATSANWGGSLPGASDTAVISAGFAVSHASGTDSIGGLTLSSANALNVSGGSLSVSGAALLDGSFTVSGSGAVTLGGAVSGVGSVALQGGTLTLNGSTSLVALNFSGGTLGGSGSLDVNGSFTRSGGTVAPGLARISLQQASGNLAAGALSAGTLALATQDAAGTLLVDGALASTGTLTLDAAGALQVAAGVTAQSMVLQGRGVQLGSAGLLSASATTGDAIIINAGSGPFVNGAGASALTVAAGGRWLVYSADPAADTLGGLVAAFRQYNATYPAATPAAGGNGLLYSLAPVLTGSLQGTVSKVYDGTTNATLLPANYGLAGALASDAVAYSATPGSGSYTSGGSGSAPRDVGTGKTVTASGLSVTATDRATGIPVFGYQFSGTASGVVGVITPATLSYVATPTTATAGVALPVLTGNVSGLVGGDTLASATTGTLAWNTTATASSAPGSYAINGSGLAALNYQFAQDAGNASALTLQAAPPPPTSVAAQTTATTTTALTVAVAAVTVPEVVSTPTTGRVLDAVPSLAGSATAAVAATAGSSADTAAISFRPINLSQTPREDLQTLLAARASFKKKVFVDSLSKLEQDPALADARPCRDEAELAGGQCVLTENLKQQILQARAAQAAAAATPTARPVVRAVRKVRQAALPVIERKLALLVGTDRYADGRIPQLLNAVSDVRAVRGVLEGRLGYETTVVEDGSKQAIIAALNKLALEAGPHDSVMIYYAGHGVVLPENGNGYWIPADAKADIAESWLSNTDISRLVALVGARQMMLVSDSCYSGSLVGSAGVQVDRAAGADDLLSRKAVVVMSSGGDEPVSDEGRDGHSVFAWHLMQALGDVDRWQMGGSVFERLRGAVSKEFPQTPRYGVVRAGGHQGNTDYLFERRELESGAP